MRFSIKLPNLRLVKIMLEIQRAGTQLARIKRIEQRLTTVNKLLQ